MSDDLHNHYIAFDPGKNTGVATFDCDGVSTGMDTMRGPESLDKYLDTLEALEYPQPKVLIYERYRAGFSKAGIQGDKYSKIHGGKANITEQAIGAILRTARKLKMEIVAQDASILAIAEKWTGIKVPSPGHSMHDTLSAFNHGMFFLVKNNIIKPRILNDLNNTKRRLNKLAEQEQSDIPR